MKILITGSTGLLGSEAVKFFTEKGWEVFGLDANLRHYFFGTPSKVAQYSIDIRSSNAVNDLFKKVRFDAIIHAAAQPSHDWAQKEPLTDFDINARGTLILLEAMRKYSPEAVFVHVSTDKVYGENMKRKDLKETETRYTHEWLFNEMTGLDEAGQRSLFGCSKLAGDVYAQEYANYFGLKVGVFRPGCITGASHEGAEYHGFLAYLAKCIKTGEPYRIFGYKGKQVRDQIHAYDLVNAFYYFIQNPRLGEVYNMGGGSERSVSVLEAIDLIEKETEKKAVTEYIDKERKGDRCWDIHDMTKFREHYPEWDYKYSLDMIIKDLCN